MTKKEGARLQETAQLRDWCVAILHFIRDVAPPAPFFGQFQQAIEAAFERRDLKGLRMVSTDLVEWTQDLAVDQRASLDQLLVSRFGRGLVREAEQNQRRLSRILRRGTIETEDEFRLLSSRADEIHADDSKAGELERINRLLVAFQQDSMGE